MEPTEQLEELRKKWKTATPENRKVIEMRAKLIKMSLSAPQKTTAELAEDIFLGREQLTVLD